MSGLAKVNEVLRCVALVLGIVLMAAALVMGLRAWQVYDATRDAINELGGVGQTVPSEAPLITPNGGDAGFEGVPDDELPPVECYDPGGGMVCAPGGADMRPGGE